MSVYTRYWTFGFSSPSTNSVSWSLLSHRVKFVVSGTSWTGFVGAAEERRDFISVLCRRCGAVEDVCPHGPAGRLQLPLDQFTARSGRDENHTSTTVTSCGQRPEHSDCDYSFLCRVTGLSLKCNLRPIFTSSTSSQPMTSADTATRHGRCHSNLLHGVTMVSSYSQFRLRCSLKFSSSFKWIFLFVIILCLV